MRWHPIALIVGLAVTCKAWTYDASCAGKEDILERGFQEMRDMSTNAATIIANPPFEPRVYWFIKAMIGIKSDHNVATQGYLKLASLTKDNTPRLTFYCNEDHFTVVKENVNGVEVNKARRDTKTGKDYPLEPKSDANGHMCYSGSGIMGYRYPQNDLQDNEFIVLCPELFNENREDRQPGLFLDEYRSKDQNPERLSRVDGAPMLDEYHLLSTTLLHELTHTSVSEIKSEDVVFTYTMKGEEYKNKKAYGFSYCWLLKKQGEDPETPDPDLDLVLSNADTYANLALGLYLDKNFWGRGHAEAPDRQDNVPVPVEDLALVRPVT